MFLLEKKLVPLKQWSSSLKHTIHRFLITLTCIMFCMFELGSGGVISFRHFHPVKPIFPGFILHYMLCFILKGKLKLNSYQVRFQNRPWRTKSNVRKVCESMHQMAKMKIRLHKLQQ